MLQVIDLKHLFLFDTEKNQLTGENCSINHLFCINCFLEKSTILKLFLHAVF